MQFTRAEKKKLKARIAFCGPSGSGKTHSALLVAGGLAPGGNIILIDSENRSALMESGKRGIPEFLHGVLSPPFSPKSYIDGLHSAAKAGADVIILDSLSHAWTGEGGVLEMHDRAAKSQRNSFAAWRHVTPEHNALVDALIYCPCHIIITMRTKTHYDMINENGKIKPVKVGLKPVQKEGLEYEFQIVFDLSVDGHIATASKDRTSIFDGQHVLPCQDTGKMLANYLDEGLAETKPEPAPETRPNERPLSENIQHPLMMSKEQSDLITFLIKSHIFSEDEKAWAASYITKTQYRVGAKQTIDRLLSLIKSRKAEEVNQTTGEKILADLIAGLEQCQTGEELIKFIDEKKNDIFRLDDLNDEFEKAKIKRMIFLGETEEIPFGGVIQDERTPEEIRQDHKSKLADLIAGLDSCTRPIDVSDYLEQVTGALLLLPEEMQDEFNTAQGLHVKNL